MGVHTVITHALAQGARMEYVGTQSWGPGVSRTVTVLEPWGGRRDPLYVVRPDGASSVRYVVGERELVSLGGGVVLGKASDGVLAPCVEAGLSVSSRAVARAVEVGPLGVGPGLDRNDLRALALTFDVMARIR